MQRLLIVYSSTSGHTEYVLDVLQKYLAEKKAPLEISMKHVETVKPGIFSRVTSCSSRRPHGTPPKGCSPPISPHLSVRHARSISRGSRRVSLGSATIGISMPAKLQRT